MIEALLEPSVLGTAITVFGGAIVTWVGLLVRRLTVETRAVRHQVQNDHSTNLREDLDLIRDDVRSVLESLGRQDETLRQHGNSIGGLRDDLRLERVERLALAGRVDRIPHA